MVLEMFGDDRWYADDFGEGFGVVGGRCTGPMEQLSCLRINWTIKGPNKKKSLGSDQIPN